MTKESMRSSARSEIKRNTKEFKIRKSNYLKGNKIIKEENKNIKKEPTSQQSEQNLLGKQSMNAVESEKLFKNLPSRRTSGNNENQDYFKSSDGFRILKTSKIIRPQTANYDGIKVPVSSINGKTLIKVPEDNLELTSKYWKNKTIKKSSSSTNFSPQLAYPKRRNLHTRQGERRADNFIKRIENRALSATKSLRNTYNKKHLTVDLKAKYKMMIINWGKELEKHNKILEKFHIFTPLKYDIDATFHKLFSSKSKGMIKEKLMFKKKSNLMKAGFLENEIDLMFEGDPNARNNFNNIESQDLLLTPKYEERENNEKIGDLEYTHEDLVNLKSPQSHLPDNFSADPVHEEEENIASQEHTAELKPEISKENLMKSPAATAPLVMNQNDDLEGIKSTKEFAATPLKIDDPEVDDLIDIGSAYSSPFKNKEDLKETQEHEPNNENNEALDSEFVDKDIQMKIRDKDIVFIYEIDDIIKEITSSKKMKRLDEHPEILDTLNRFSKLFRHYIRYRVADIGDLTGGLFLDGFWKSLLITIDNILQSIDERFKRRVVRLQNQFAKVVEKMNKKLEDKDREMRAMNQTEYIETLKERLDLIK